MEFFRKIAAGLVKHDINEFVGEQGNIFFSIETGEMRLSDGITPGGIPLGSGGGSGFTLLPARPDRLGGVKIGANINVGLDGTISVAAPFSGSYNDLQDQPNLSQYQLKSTAFDGKYSSLTGAPEIPVVPRGLSGFTNDVGFLSRSDLNAIAFTGDYNSLINKPTIPSIPTDLSAFNNDRNFITLNDVTWSNVRGKPTWSTVAYSGSYNDLSNKPTIPTVPTNLSSFVNDTNFLKPVDLTWNNILDKPTYATVATTGSYTDLSNKPFIPTDISQLTDLQNFIQNILPDFAGNAGKVLATDGTGLYWKVDSSGTTITDVSQLTDVNNLYQQTIDFNQLATNVSPVNSDQYNLGAATKRWNDLWIKNIRFNTSVSINTANNALVIASPNGIVLTGSGEIKFPDGSSLSSANGLNVTVNFPLKGTVGTGNLSNNDTLTFASNTGVISTVDKSTVTIDTPQDLRPTASPTFNNPTVNNVHVNSITYPDGTTQTTANTSSGGGTPSGPSTGVIKTFNIVGSFAAPVPGTAVFVPFTDTSIRSIQLVNSEMVLQQLQVGLYKNGLLLGLYSIVPGNFTSKYTALDLPITTQDRITCSVLSGFGNNFSLVLSSSF